MCSIVEMEEGEEEEEETMEYNKRARKRSHEKE